MSNEERLFCSITWGEQLHEPLKWIRVRHTVARSVIKNISGTSSETDSNMSLQQTQLASPSETHAHQECPPVLASDQCSQKGRARAGFMGGEQVEESELKHGNMQ